MICDFLASFSRREDKRPKVGRSEEAGPRASDEAGPVDGTPETISRPAPSEILP